MQTVETYAQNPVNDVMAIALAVLEDICSKPSDPVTVLKMLAAYGDIVRLSAMLPIPIITSAGVDDFISSLMPEPVNAALATIFDGTLISPFVVMVDESLPEDVESLQGLAPLLALRDRFESLSFGLARCQRRQRWLQQDTTNYTLYVQVIERFDAWLAKQIRQINACPDDLRMHLGDRRLFGATDAGPTWITCICQMN